MVETLPVPDLSEANILRFKAGIRPCRHGGLRLETERLGSYAGGKIVVHNYGHGGCGVTIGLGTGDEVVREVSAVSPDREPLLVLGGGVVGLTAALRLLQAGRRVRILAEKLAPDTVSVVAGAVWLPTGVEFGASAEKVRWFHGILQRSFRAFQELDAERFGIEELPVFEPEGAPLYPEFFDNGTLDDPTPLDVLPIGARRGPGRVFRTIFIHTPRFLNAVVEEVRSLGGVIEHGRVDRLSDLGGVPEPVVVNCLAMGSRTLFDDSAMYPARGMLVHMKPQPLGYIVHDGYKYMFPRQDALVLGGCFLPDDWRDFPDETICREILDHHRRFFGQA